MEKIVALLDELFIALEGLSSPIEIVEIIFMAIMMHRLKSTKSTAAKVETTSDPVSPSSLSVPDVTPKEKKSVKNQLKSQLLADLDLLFSDKTEEQMTVDENARCSRLLNLIQEMKK